jgi:hypothetical protein
MKATIKEMSAALKAKFAGKTFAPCTRRNGTPSQGWTTTGYGPWTKAVISAGLPHNHFWSGSLPTPSTQIPVEVYDYLNQKYPKP